MATGLAIKILCQYFPIFSVLFKLPKEDLSFTSTTLPYILLTLE